VEGRCVRPHNLAFSQFRLQAASGHLEASALRDLNQINLLYICLLWNMPILTCHLILKRTSVILFPPKSGEHSPYSLLFS